MEAVFREIKSQIYMRKRCNINYPAHIHDDIELVYIRSGKGNAWCDGKHYALSDGDWFLVFPNQVHRYADFEEGIYDVLILKPSDLFRYQQIFRTGAPNHAVQRFEEDAVISFLLQTALQEFTLYGFNEIIAAYLTALFGKLLPHFPIARSVYHNDNVLKILEYCSAHYKEDLSIASVAEQLQLSRSCISHIFSERISMSFSDYIHSLRLGEARENLKNQEYSITEIANLSGFPTIRTFNRAFQKHYGMSPSEYRKRWPAE